MKAREIPDLTCQMSKAPLRLVSYFIQYFVLCLKGNFIHLNSIYIIDNYQFIFCYIHLFLLKYNSMKMVATTQKIQNNG